jgi:hypothetical protein
MSTTATFSAYLPAKSPRGAQLVGFVYDTIAAFAARLDARRAALRRRSRAAEAEEVRRFAQAIQDSDPGFAADLFAAADRHTQP